MSVSRTGSAVEALAAAVCRLRLVGAQMASKTLVLQARSSDDMELLQIVLAPGYVGVIEQLPALAGRGQERLPGQLVGQAI